MEEESWPIRLAWTWATEFGLTLGQVACAEKSNEITAIPELVKLVDIHGAIITIDAMGTQTAIAAEIIDGGGDYVLALKGNQETLHQKLPGASRWKGLQSIGIVLLTCLRNGKQSTELRYYISSLPVGVKRFARAVRGHWGIENSCHWCLDVTYREDESRIRDRNLRENFAWLRRFTLSLLKQHSGKDSIAMTRRSCGWSDDFLLQVLAGETG